METVLLTVAIMSLSLFGLAIGAIFARKAITGSWGGLGKIMGDDCMFCDKKDEC